MISKQSASQPPELLAQSLYELPDLKAPVYQFIVDSHPISAGILEDPRVSWRHHCRAGFHVRITSGVHHTMLDEPNASTLAQHFEEALNQCLAQRKRPNSGARNSELQGRA